RIEYEGAIYHVIQRGNNREYIFEEHRWKKNLLQEITKSIEVDQMELFAFVIMGNHYHLALRTDQIPLSKIMHRINSNFSRYYNRDRGRTGSVFEGRYKAFPIENENYLLSVIRYIHRNPVRASICSSIDEYSWSSDQAYRGRDFSFVRTDVLLSILGSNPNQAKLEYNRLMGLEDDYDENAIKYLGTEEFWSQKTYKPVPKAKKKDLETILLESGADENSIRLIKNGCKQRDLMVYKRDFVQRAFAAGYSMEEIGKHISISGVAVGKILRKLEG
ncbi:MAG: hypothetical protein GXY50_05540, partial [Syntrophomonadaceae bacterium]|nr:hypothetical protein [Syntrophomonadaceae bacterium]